MPILFLAGEKDEVIPAPHMQQLYAAAQKGGGPRGIPLGGYLLTVVWKSWPHGMHNDTCLQHGYFEKIGEFVKEHVYSTPRRRGRTLGDSEKAEEKLGS